MSPLNGKVALVTGGSRGIGAAIAQRLARDGASVALTYQSDATAAERVVKAIAADGGTATAIKADAADEAAIRAAFAATLKAFGRLDILVNNAGILRMGPVDAMSVEDLDATLAVNVRGVFISAQEAARHMADGGRIITIGSVNAERIPFAGGAAYGMSKAAVVGLTQGLARDLGPRNITVNVIQPGPIDTDMNPADGPFAPHLTALMALPRYGKATDIAGMVAYLAGPEAGFVTGAALTVDGGFLA